MKLNLHTSRYSAGDIIINSGCIPVRISVGSPRFATKYALLDAVVDLAPDYSTIKMEPVDFNPRYLAKLEKKGLAHIRRQLEAVATRRNNPNLVLLCFENVLKGEACHRRLFAEVWERWTGEAVPELAEKTSTKEKPKPSLSEPENKAGQGATQGSLFGDL